MNLLVKLVEEDYGIEGSGRWFRSAVHSSLVVDAEKNKFYFNSRNVSGDTLEYLTKVRGLSVSAAKDIMKCGDAGAISTKDTSVQVRFEKLVDSFYMSGKTDREYWYKRLISDSTIDRYRLGHFDGWNLVPIYDDGMFVNFQCRRDEPDKSIRFWYKDHDFKPVLFNKDVLKFVDSVYITEGVTDCILLNQLGMPAVCSTNGALSWSTSWIKYFMGIKSVTYIADNDKAGINGAYKCASVIGPYKVTVVRFKEKREKYGAKDFFVDGGTVEEFKNYISTNGVAGFQKEAL